MENQDKLLRELEVRERQKKANIKPNKSSFLKKLKKIIISLVIFILIIFGYFYAKGGANEENGLSWVNKIPVIGQIKKLAESSNVPLSGEERGRINILLLGTGGKNHEGANLTDTIIVASFDLKTNQVAMLSIPRDLVIPVQDMGWPKINHVNSYAEAKEPGSGGRVTSEVIGKLLDTKIDYYFTLNFNGFIEVVDELGGIEVYVDNTFDDYHYPILGQEKNPNWDARFEHLRFDQGWTEMDGSLALKYSRSRYAAGIEGTDFARAARQQKVIMAVKEKLLSKSTLLNPRLISDLINQVRENVHSNMKIWEIVRMWNLFKDIDQDNIINKVLSNRPSGLLVDSESKDGAYTLVPRSGDYSEIKYLFQNMFYQIPEKEQMSVSEEQAKLQVLNGTFIAGLASKTATDLEKYGFNIVHIANCSHQDFENSVIYDLSYGEKKKSIEILREQTSANISPIMPDWLKEDIKKGVTNGDVTVQPDIILILGQNANQTPLSTEDVDI